MKMAYVTKSQPMSPSSVVYSTFTNKKYLNFFICIFFIIVCVVLMSHLLRSRRQVRRLPVKTVPVSQELTRQELSRNLALDYFFENEGQDYTDLYDSTTESDYWSQTESSDYYYYDMSSTSASMPFMSWFNDYESLNTESKSDAELQAALEKISKLENQIKNFEMNTNKEYPAVTELDITNQKRILVTGGAGFVGSHLVDRLLRDGHQVFIVDDFSTGRRQNIMQWMGHPNFEVVHQDITQVILLDVEQIYHMASPNIASAQDPLKVFKTLTTGTQNVMGLAKRLGARVLIGSSCEVYGTPSNLPISETYFGNVDPTSPLAAFEEGKRAQEALAYAYQRNEGVDIRVARIFNTYGPRMPGYGPMGNLLRQGLRKKKLSTVGMRIRSFLYVSDLVDGLVQLMSSSYTGPVNLGSPEIHSLQELEGVITRMVVETGTGDEEIKIENTNLIVNKEIEPEVDVIEAHLWPNISLAIRVLEWSPKVSLEEGVKQTWMFLTHPIPDDIEITEATSIIDGQLEPENGINEVTDAVAPELQPEVQPLVPEVEPEVQPLVPEVEPKVQPIVPEVEPKEQPSLPEVGSVPEETEVSKGDAIVKEAITSEEGSIKTNSKKKNN